jgi:rubrerythrin
MTLLLQPTLGLAEVRIDKATGNIVMSPEDFRVLMTDLSVAEAERDALKLVLENERKAVDMYVEEVEALRNSLSSERTAWKASVEEQKNKRWSSFFIGAALAGIASSL